MCLMHDVTIEQNKYVFDISSVSEQGGRPVNEDSVVVESSEEQVLLSIADGLGAHGCGDVASGIASDGVKNDYPKLTKPTPANVQEIFLSINDAILAEQTEEIQMKTTLACVLCRRNRIYGAHVGDTRIYTFRGSGKMYHTADHTFAYEEIMKNHGTLDDLRNNPNRHILSAALGVEMPRPPDQFRQRIGDRFSLLICSDGFWEYVSEADMLDALENMASSHDWLEKMLQLHAERADRFHDNYSAICLRIMKKKNKGETQCNSKA